MDLLFFFACTYSMMDDSQLAVAAAMQCWEHDSCCTSNATSEVHLLQSSWQHQQQSSDTAGTPDLPI
jgi:hypothetical protein